jgi:NADPH:quinone reductase-like Zn-dependent oxidoreductase
VKATSVNPIDMKVRKLPLPFAPAMPAVLHGDFSGVVAEVSADVQL